MFLTGYCDYAQYDKQLQPPTPLDTDFGRYDGEGGGLTADLAELFFVDDFLHQGLEAGADFWVAQA
jgi:hypothetical protein